MSWAISLLFFLSGFTGLLYEVLWAKCLALTLGSTALAQTSVLALFLGGLALGNAFLGPRADKAKDPLRFYGWLELGIAALGLASGLLPKLSGLPGSLPLQVLLCSVFLLPPTFLMGGTLPALSRRAARDLDEMQRAVGWLYFLNSAGAALGALAAGFFIIPAWGLAAAIRFAAGLNLLIGAGALALGRARGDAGAGRAPARAPAPPRVLLAVVFVSGFVSLGYEIAWTRLLALVLGSSAYSFSLMLAAFIAGIALGGLIVARGWHPRASAYALLGWAQLGLALSISATLPLYDKLSWLALLLDRNVPRTPGMFYLFEAAQLAMCLLLMLAPTTFLGMSLPLASRAAVGSASSIAGDVGRVFGLNTLGNVLGAWAAGLWLLPALGIRGLIQAGVVLNLAAAAAVLRGAMAWTPRRKAALGAAAALCLAALWLAPLDRAVLSNGPFRKTTRLRALPSFGFGLVKEAVHRAGTLLYYKDGRETTVSVFKNQGHIWLKVNGKTDASSAGDMATQALTAQLPLTLSPGARDVLMIGLGSGVSAGSILTHPVDRLDVAELSPEVVAASGFFDEVNGRPLRDPRLALSVADGKTFLARTRRRYDLILSEPSNPWIAGVGNLFTAEFYLSARQRLKPGGLMAQWFHLYEMSDDALRLILRTYAGAFPCVTLWHTTSNDILLLGSEQPLRPDFPRLLAEFGLPAVRRDLARVQVKEPTTLLALQMGSDAMVRGLAGRGELNRDLSPRLEYEAPKAFFLDKPCWLPYRADERLGRGAAQLALGRFLAFRRRGLSEGEYREAARFQAVEGTAFGLQLLGGWLKRFPSDEARLALAQAQNAAGQSSAARATLRPLLSAGRPPAAALQLGAVLAAEPASKLALLRRLVRTEGADLAQAYQDLARFYETESYEKAVDLLGKAADAAARKGDLEAADSLWMQAALVAIRRYDSSLSLDCARKALHINPQDEAAKGMIEGLERVEALDKKATESYGKSRQVPRSYP